jgi:hypothetical protein
MSDRDFSNNLFIGTWYNVNTPAFETHSYPNILRIDGNAKLPMADINKRKIRNKIGFGVE